MTRITVAIGLFAILQGCAATDPLLNESDWQPTGANEMNIAAQVANPADLIHGRQAAGGSDGDLAAAAILRLRTDHVKKLPDSAITDLQVQSSPTVASGP
jgi:type IV pilus biogenesis protein CpaD/CtpE